MKIVENSVKPNAEQVKDWDDEYLLLMFSDNIYREYMRVNNVPMYEMVLEEIIKRRNQKINEIYDI